MTKDRVITVGIDGSPASGDALDWAAREAARRGARLRVIHAYSVPVYGGGFGLGLAMPPVEFETLRVTHQDIAEEQLAAIRNAYPTVETELRVECSGPVTTITRAADDAELVVVGSTGAGSIANLFIGSVAHGVAHRAPCPAVLVPAALTPEGVAPERVEHSAPARIVVGTDGSPAAATVDVRVCPGPHRWRHPCDGDPAGEGDGAVQDRVRRVQGERGRVGSAGVRVPVRLG